jgi:hypothetical protein
MSGGEPTAPERRAPDPNIALLSKSIKHLTKRMEEWQATAKEERAEMRDEIKLLQTEMTRYKGVLGGITLVFSAVAAALMLAKGWLIGKS